MLALMNKRTSRPHQSFWDGPFVGWFDCFCQLKETWRYSFPKSPSCVKQVHIWIAAVFCIIVQVRTTMRVFVCVCPHTRVILQLLVYWRRRRDSKRRKWRRQADGDKGKLAKRGEGAKGEARTGWQRRRRRRGQMERLKKEEDKSVSLPIQSPSK